MKSVLDLAQTSKRPRRHSLTRFVLGALLVLVVLAVVFPGFVPACGCGSPEHRAIGILSAIDSAESTFWSSRCGGDGYAQSLEDLVTLPPGATAGFISSDISPNGVRVDGYVFTVMAGPRAEPVTAASKTCNSANADAVSQLLRGGTSRPRWENRSPVVRNRR